MTGNGLDTLRGLASTLTAGPGGDLGIDALSALARVAAVIEAAREVTSMSPPITPDGPFAHALSGLFYALRALDEGEAR